MNNILSRLTKPEYACYIALGAASRSEDPFNMVGIAAFDENWNTLGTGTNGLKPGMKVLDWMFLEENRKKKSELFLHAESNLFRVISDNPIYLGITMSPCFACSKEIASKGVKEIFYLREYDKCNKFKEVFDFYGVKYTQLSTQSIQNIVNKMTEQLNLLKNV